MANNGKGLKKRYEGVPCPQNGCDTVFSGTKLQIINNFRTHYRGTHIKKDEELDFNKDKVRDKIKKGIHEKRTIEGGSENDIFKILETAFYETLKYNEPETSVEDESVIGLGVVDKKIGSNYDLVNYLSFPPICKEERQFALCFANKLENKDPVIIKRLMDRGLLLERDIIEKVYFEVAIMRDYWNSNKKVFNEALLDYVTSNPEKFPVNIKLNTDGHKIDEGCELHANSWTPPNAIARWMMNAKPDIGLIIKRQGKCILSFIECKYTSNEVPYKHEEVEGSLKQTELQEIILDFIVNKLEAKYNEESLEKGQVRLVRFIHENRSNDNEIEINVKDLINKT